MTENTDLTAVILEMLRTSRRTLADADLARDIEQAVREHLAVECADELLARIAQEPIDPDPHTERLYAVTEQRIEHAVAEMGERLRGLSADTARIAEEVAAELREQLAVEARDGHRIEAEVTATAERTEYGLDLRVVIDGERYEVTHLSLSV